MVPFFLALEANNVGRILYLILAILLVVLVLQLDSGLVLDIGVESKPTLVIGGFLYTQDFVECDLPLMTLFQVILQRSDLSSLISSTWLVSTKTLEEVDATLLEQQGTECNSSRDISWL